MEPYIYYIISLIVTIMVLFGIFLMNKVKTARLGNAISAFAIIIAIIATILYFDVFSPKQLISIILISAVVASLIGILIAYKVKMIQMPELVALLNGLGGAASTIVGAVMIFVERQDKFVIITSILALLIGFITFVGSMIAGGKLAKIIDGKPVIWQGQRIILLLCIILITAGIIIDAMITIHPLGTIIFMLALSGIFAFIFTIRVGGADMPITISLLNSLSGVAGAIAGIALGDIMLITIGAIVGSSGLVLTEIMSKAINRPLRDILGGKSVVRMANSSQPKVIHNQIQEDPIEWLKKAKRVIMIPGYGMALAQAQYLVKDLTDLLEAKNCEVRFAIHPVAGRMPGHMNVLLAEAGIDYDKLFEMDDINDDFKLCDVAIVIGANDVLNPAAREAVGTPIYGMPILNVDYAPKIIFFNYDTKPGYSGVDNPLYYRAEGIVFMLGNAKDTLASLIAKL